MKIYRLVFTALLLLIFFKENAQPLWMRYPAVSPDGNTIVFSYKGDLYKVSSNGGIAIPLTIHKAYDYKPVWSPDGKWFLVSYKPNNWIINEAGLIKSDGSGEVINLTKSGYSDNGPQWMMKGNALLWFTDRNGLRSHGSWGAHYDAYAMFFNKKAFDRFKLSEEEFEVLKENEKEKEKEKKKDEEPAKKKSKEKTSETKKDKPLIIELDKIEDRTARLTIHSSDLAYAILSPEADKLYYLSRFEKGHDLWMHDLKKNETKLILKLEGRGGYMQVDTAFKNLYVFSGGNIVKVGIDDHKKKPVSYNAEP